MFHSINSACYLSFTEDLLWVRHLSAYCLE